MTDSAQQLGCQTADMVMIHKMFRREFQLAPQMVRNVAAGDAAQATRVSTYLTEIVTALHHHHQGEDRIVWETLVDRSPGCALHVGQMKAQHAEVAELLNQVAGLSSAWSPTAAEDAQRQLAELLDEISAKLDAHLGQEEADILPVAATSFTQAEWDRLGDEGMAHVPKNRLLVQLGYILEDADPQERTEILARVPAPARLLYKLIGRRQYEKEIRTLRPPA